MAKEYYCYPRDGFEPEVCTHEGLCLAHAQGTPFWLSEKGDVFIRYANGRWHRRIVDTCARKSYNTRTFNGVIRGKTYPGVTYKGVHYRVQRGRGRIRGRIAAHGSGWSDASRCFFRSKCQVKTLLHERKQQKKGDDTIAGNPDNADPMSASNADEMDGEMMRKKAHKCVKV